MKRLDTHQTKNFRPLAMTGGDLTHIVETLAPCKRVTVVADNVQFDSVEEFISESRGKSPKVLSITTAEPYIAINFNQSSASLYVSSSDVTSSGLFAKLVYQIEETERKPRLLHSYWYVAVSTWIIQLAFTIPALKSFDLLQVLLMFANVFWTLWVVFIQLRRFSFIQPMGAQDARTFWQRNSDGMVVAIFSAVLGALGGAAATKFADRVWPTPSLAATEPRTTPAVIGNSTAASASMQRPQQ